MPNRSNHRRPGGGNFNSYNSYGVSEYTQTGYPQPFNYQMGYEPSYQGPTNYGWHQRPPTHQTPGYPGSEWSHNHDFNHTRHPYPSNSNYSTSNYHQHCEKPWQYVPRQENPRPNFTMRNNQSNQYNPIQSNSFSNKFRPFNNRNAGRVFKQATKQYGGGGQYETQEDLPCQDEKMSLPTTDQPTKPPSYIAANNWQQAGTADDEVMEASSWKPVKRGNVHRQTKGLMKGLNQPVEADKAQRMMAMMGWQGGALGCNGDGLTEPLMPNLLHQKGAGLGHKHPPPDTKAKKLAKPHKTIQKIQEKLNREKKSLNSVKKSERKRQITTEQELLGLRMVRRRPKVKNMRHCLSTDLQTKILRKILGFVSDPTQDKLAFDKTLTRQQRAYIHFFAEAVGASDGVLYDGQLDDAEQTRIIEGICECNSYVLTTESQGEGGNRQIIMYKEAPVNMYLITKDDIDDDYDETDDEVDDEDIEEDKVIAIDDSDLDDDYELKNAELGNDDDETSNANDNTDENITEDKVAVRIDPIEKIDNIELDPNAEEPRDSDEKINRSDIDEVKSDQIIKDNDCKGEINPNDDVVKESIEDASKRNEMEHTPIIETEKETKIEHEPIQREDKIKILLLKYFKEFFEDTTYTELRFLGHFDDVEEKAIVNFVTDIDKCIEDNSYCKNLTKEDWLSEIFLDTTYKLMTMANTEGYSDNIIEKILRKDLGAESDSGNIQ